MSTSDAWARPLATSGGRDALVYAIVPGAAPDQLVVSAERHGVLSVPEGLAVTTISGDELNALLSGTYLSVLERDVDTDVLTQTLAASGGVVLRGVIPAPTHLAYWQAAIGIAAAALEAGGIGVLEVQPIRMHTPESWVTDVVGAKGPVPSKHLSTFASDEAGDTTWLHTRGLRQFGRPDLSVRGLASANVGLVSSELGALSVELVLGRLLKDGEIIELSIGECEVALSGDDEDLDFNNEHAELVLID